jgi:predicted DNA-binding protein (UPF0251 family)
MCHRPHDLPTSKPQGIELPKADRDQLRKLIEDIGENAAREQLGISRGAFSRCLAGLTVRPGTVALVRQGLGKAGAS